MKRIIAMAAALLICAGNMGYMPESTKSIGGFTANAAEVAADSVEINEANFPDAKFRQYVADNLDTNDDGVLSAKEIEAVTEIKVNNMGISDLTGIEHFTALESLRCEYNNLTSLNVNNNPALEILGCGDNQLTSIDLSSNPALKSLNCYNNELTSLDVSSNPALATLDCFTNQITSLDVSKNTALTYLQCGHNNLTSLDLSNNEALEFLTCYGNQLTSLDLSNNIALETALYDDNNYEITVTGNTFDLSTLPTGFDAAKTSSWTNATVEGNILTIEDVTKEVTYIYNCGNGKAEIFTLIPKIVSNPPANITEINETNFPDAKFRQYVADNFDTDGDGVLSAEEITEIAKINIEDKGISDLTGIEYFTALEILLCNNNQLASLNISNNTTLTELNCESNQLPSLDVSNNTALTYLNCSENQLTSLDVSNNTALTGLNCVENQLTSLDVSGCIALNELLCYENQLTSLDLSNNTALEDLKCDSNQLTSLNLSNSSALKLLWCYGNQLTSLDLSNNTALENLWCYENQLTSLDLSNNTALENLRCSNNQLTSLDVSNCTALTELYCYDNQLTSLDVSNNTALTDCHAHGEYYEIALTNNTFDLSTLPTGFDAAKTSSWTNATVEGNILTIEDVTKEVTYIYNCGNGKAEIFRLFVTLATGDVNNDGTIDSSDATLVLSDYAVIATGGTSTFTDEQIKAADVNKDKKCDSIDASLILAYYGYTSTGGTGTIEEYLSKTDAEEQLKALREKKESEVQLFAAAYIGCTEDMNEVDAVKWIKENSPAFCENYSFVEDIPSGQIAGTHIGELYCIVPFDENSTVAINSAVYDENGNGSYENVIYRSESGEPVLLFCNNAGVDGDTMVTITDSDGNKDVWFPCLDEKLMMNCPYNANYDAFIYDFSHYQEILEKEHTSRKNSGWKLPTAADLQFTNWSGVDYRGSEVIGSYQIEFGKDTAYIKWVDGNEEHEFKDVEWQLEVEKDAAVVTFNFNEFAGILQYNFLWNENNSKLYTAVNFTNEDTLDENLKLYRILDRFEYSETNS